MSYTNFIQLTWKVIQILEEVRNEYETETNPIVINASIGPPGDGYNPTLTMLAEQSKIYHLKQIRILSQTKADMITALK